MQEIAFFDLTLIQRFRDYINFSLRYTYGDHVCSAQAMGWIQGDEVLYYLNHIMVNDRFARKKDLALIGISEVGMRFLFEHPELDALTKSQIKAIFSKK
jgi:hypothetical protein